MDTRELDKPQNEPTRALEESPSWDQLDFSVNETVLQLMGDLVFVLNYDFEIEEVYGSNKDLVQLVRSLNAYNTRLDHFVIFKDSLDDVRDLFFRSFMEQKKGFICKNLNLYFINQAQEFSVCVINDFDNRGLLQIIVVCKESHPASILPDSLPFYSAIDIAVDGMALLDEDWKLVYCNPSMESLLEMGKNEIIQNPIDSFFDIRFFRKTFPRLNHFMKTNKTWKGRIPILSRSSRPKVFMVSISKTEDNNYFLVLRDSSKYFHREEKNNKKLQNYKKFLNQSQGIFFKLLYEPNIDFFSLPVLQGSKKDPSLTEILTDIQSDPDRIYNFIHPSDRNRLRRLIRYSILTLKPFRAKLRFLISEEYSWREISAVTELTPSQTIIFHGYIHNIHTEKMNFQKLESVEKEKLDLSNLTIKQNHKLHQFSQIVSHNIRNHSSNIKILLELLNEERDDISFNSHLSSLIQSSEQLFETTNILNQILNQDIDSIGLAEPVRIRPLVEEVFQQVSSLSRECEVDWNMELPESLYINGIKVYISNILFHLLSNAVKFRSPERKLKVSISHREEKEYSIICIQDNGLGIDLDKNKKKIFQMYKVFHNLPEAKGLGLFISKSQMELMNGKIEIESKRDQGTCFSLYFPKVFSLPL